MPFTLLAHIKTCTSTNQSIIKETFYRDKEPECFDHK